MPHIHEKYDFVINAVIVYAGKVLLVQHPRYDKWLAPGGHIELDEDPEEALYREVEEETGLRVSLLTPKPDIPNAGSKVLPRPDFMDVHEANPPHQNICMFYYLQAESGEAVLSGEHSAIRWVGEDELNDPELELRPVLKHCFAEAIHLAEQTGKTSEG